MSDIFEARERARAEGRDPDAPAGGGGGDAAVTRRDDESVREANRRIREEIADRAMRALDRVVLQALDLTDGWATADGVLGRLALPRDCRPGIDASLRRLEERGLADSEFRMVERRRGGGRRYFTTSERGRREARPLV